MAVDECWIAAISTKSSATDKKVPVSMASKVEVNLVLPEMKTTSGDVWSSECGSAMQDLEVQSVDNIEIAICIAPAHPVLYLISCSVS